MSFIEATVIVEYFEHYNMARLIQQSGHQLVCQHMPRLGLPCPKRENIFIDPLQPSTIRLVWPKVLKGGPLHRNLLLKTDEHALQEVEHLLDEFQIETIDYQQSEILHHGWHHALEKPRQHPYALAQASRVSNQKPQQSHSPTIPQQPVVSLPAVPITEQTIPGIDPQGMTGIAPLPKVPVAVPTNDTATRDTIIVQSSPARPPIHDKSSHSPAAQQQVEETPLPGATAIAPSSNPGAQPSAPSPLEPKTQVKAPIQSLNNASDKSETLPVKSEAPNGEVLVPSGSGSVQSQAPSTTNSLRVQFFRELSLKDQKLAEVQKAAADREKVIVQRFIEIRKSQETLVSKMKLGDEKLAEMQRALSVATAKEKVLLQRLSEVRKSEEMLTSKVSLNEGELVAVRRALTAAGVKEKAYIQRLAEVKRLGESSTSRLSELNHGLEERLKSVQHTFADEQRKRIELEERLTNTEDDLASEQRQRMAAEEQLKSAENALVDERRKRLEAEGILADITREQKEPFVVPALLEAFMSISKMTTAIKEG